MNCGVGHRGGSDLELLCLWHRPVAVAQIKTPSLGISICFGCGPKKQRKKKKFKIPLSKKIHKKEKQAF